MTVDMSQFYQTFFEESLEGLDTMESELLNLDVGDADKETVNTIFRAAHSIKGGAATFGFDEVASFTHVIEAILDEMRTGERLVTQDAVTLLLSSVDCLRDLLSAVRNNVPCNQDNLMQVKHQLDALHGNQHSASTDATEDQLTNKQQATSNQWHIKFKPYDQMLKTGNDPIRLLKELRQLADLTVDIDTSALIDFDEMDPEVCYFSWHLVLVGDVDREQIDEVFSWVDGDCELIIESVGHAITQQDTSAEKNNESAAEPLPTSSVNPTHDNKLAKENVAVATERRTSSPNTDGGSIRVSIDKVDALINMVGELVITQSMLGQIGENIDLSRIEQLRDGLGQLERNTRELQESVISIRMLPISFAFQRFPRMVRDLGQRFNKKIALKLTGEQTELDKTVMEKIGDPLVHLVRNSIDHGLESPDVRVAKGKPEVGTIYLNAYHQGGNIVIDVGDDGAGLNRDRILTIAKARGLVGEEDSLTDDAIYELIFAPGFSTVETVSDVSGRGVGMDVVRRNIKELGGSIDVETQLDKGSKFTIRLPLTLAILDGQLVRVGSETYIVPLISIVESLQGRPELINAVGGQAELYRLREDYIPIVRLYDLFQIDSDTQDLTKGLLVVVEGDGKRVALFVDDLLGQQQVVIKSLETNLHRIEGVSGATILGDGTVALILDVAGIVSLSKQLGGLPSQRLPSTNSDNATASENQAA